MTVEFALLAPLLLLMLAVGVDLGRAYQAHREFEGAVTGIGRLLGASVEYDQRVRDHALPIAQVLLPPDAGDIRRGAGGRFNLQITSLVKEGGTMKQVFITPKALEDATLFGINPNLPAPNLVQASKFDNSEAVILLAATYQFVPLFLPSTPFTMTKTQVVIPYFSRRYIHNPGVSPDIYVN